MKKLQCWPHLTQLIVTDLLMAVISFLVANQLRFGSGWWQVWRGLFDNVWYYAALYLVLYIGVLALNGLYETKRVWSYAQETRKATQAVGLLAIALASAMIALKITDVSRLFLLCFFFLQWISLVSARLLVRRWVKARSAFGVGKQRAIIVGTGLQAREFATKVTSFNGSQYSLVGFIKVKDDGAVTGVGGVTGASGLGGAAGAGVFAGFCGIEIGAAEESAAGVAEESANSEGFVTGTARVAVAPATAQTIDNIPVLGTLDDLATIFHEYVVDDVFVALPLRRMDDINQVYRHTGEEGKNVHLLLDLFDAPLAHSTYDFAFGVPILTCSSMHGSLGALVVKRAIDVIASTLGIICLSPLLLCIAMAIKVDSPGPVLFKQKRVGLHGRHFYMWKFRSMVADAEARLADIKHMNEMDGPVFKVRKDPRITKVGAFLRKSSFDELPQLFNVWLGSMSLVGPRPPLVTEVQQYEPWQRRRLSMKPGITCYWQVSGRNEIDFEQWVRMDLEYIDRWNIWVDLQILFRTLPAMIKGTGV